MVRWSLILKFVLLTTLKLAVAQEQGVLSETLNSQEVSQEKRTESEKKAPQVQNIEKLEVTGSYIKRIDLEGPSPVKIIDVVLLAMLWPGVPIAAAVMLIGCGAMNTLFSRPGRQELLGMLSLAVYASLGCLAVAAQTHAAINSPAARVSVLLQIDHAAATVLLAIMIRATIRRLRSPAL